MTPSTALSSDTLEMLSANQGRKELVDYLRELEVTCGTLSREQVVTILGQWFHPLHYFPVFLSRVIAVAPEVAAQTFISRILWQELGEGDPSRAHERIYLETILDGDFSAEQVSAAPPFEATRDLVAGYQAASQDYLSGLGFLYGTEVVDLPMVSTIGELMKRCTGKQVLPWVDVHVEQEPDHVYSSNETLRPKFSEQERQQIVASAEKMWSLWTTFFKSISNAILN
ncbi:MAG TPA: iron-containing redox enzyme family protein [Pyrinomonadaceae bacterium]|nr:iron-containing redox enzyme family protein [Pyrinomonadaceae bacterium]